MAVKSHFSHLKTVVSGLCSVVPQMPQRLQSKGCVCGWIEPEQLPSFLFLSLSYPARPRWSGPCIPHLRSRHPSCLASPQRPYTISLNTVLSYLRDCSREISCLGHSSPRLFLMHSSELSSNGPSLGMTSPMTPSLD